jgi:5-methylthioribose kinase
VKQSRGYVEYPQVLAPSRVPEGAFIKKLRWPILQQIMPKLLGIDAINNMIALEDLGK